MHPSNRSNPSNPANPANPAPTGRLGPAAAPLFAMLAILAYTAGTARPWASPLTPALWTTGLAGLAYAGVRLVATARARPISEPDDLRLQGLGIGAALVAAAACGAVAAWRAQWFAAGICLALVVVDAVLVRAVRRRFHAATAPPVSFSRP